MKRLNVFTVFVLFSLAIDSNLYSQSITGFGIQAGGGPREINSIQSPSSLQDEGKLGASGGIKLEYKLVEDFLKFTPELFFYQNGTKFYKSLPDLQTDLFAGKVSLDYAGIYLPVSLYLPVNEEDNYNGFIGSAKMYIDYATKGEIVDSKGINRDISFDGSKARIDLGISLEGGFVFNGVSILFGYNKGIKNIEFNNDQISGMESTYIFNNKGLSLQLGFLAKLNN